MHGVGRVKCKSNLHPGRSKLRSGNLAAWNKQIYLGPWNKYLTPLNVFKVLSNNSYTKIMYMKEISGDSDNAS